MLSLVNMGLAGSCSSCCSVNSPIFEDEGISSNCFRESVRVNISFPVFEAIFTHHWDAQTERFCLLWLPSTSDFWPFVGSRSSRAKTANTAPRIRPKHRTMVVHWTVLFGRRLMAEIGTVYSISVPEIGWPGPRVMMAQKVKPFLYELPEGFIPSTNILNSISDDDLEDLVITYYVHMFCALLTFVTGETDMPVLVKVWGSCKAIESKHSQKLFSIRFRFWWDESLSAHCLCVQRPIFHFSRRYSIGMSVWRIWADAAYNIIFE